MAEDTVAARREYAEAFALFDEMLGDSRLGRMPEFHQRFGDLLLHLAAFPPAGSGAAEARRLLERAANRYAEVARSIASGGSPDDVRIAFDSLAALLPGLPTPVRGRLETSREELRRRLATGR